MSDTQVAQSETLETVAPNLVREWIAEWFGPPPDDMQGINEDLANRVLSALRNERERAAKIAEESGFVFYAERQKKHSPYDPKDLIFAQDVCDKIARAIREGR